MADQEFKIHIVSDANTAGFDSAGEAVKGMGKETEEANFHGGQMFRIMSELDRIAPGTGELLRAAFNPVTGSIIAVLYVVNLLVEKFEQARKAAQELREEGERLSVDAWVQQQDAIQDVIDTADAYKQKLEEIKNSAIDINSVFQDQKTLLDASLAAQQKIFEAQERAELAAAGGDAVKEAEIRKRYEDAKSSQELQGEQEKLRQQQVQANDLDLENRSNKQKSDAAAAALEKEKGVTVPTDSALAAAKNKLDSAVSATGLSLLDFQNKLAAAKTALAQEQAIPEAVPPGGGLQEDYTRWRNAHILVAQRSVDNLQKEADAIKSAEDEYHSIVTAINDHKNKLEELGTAYVKATAAYNKTTVELNELNDKIQAAASVLQINQDTAKKVADINIKSDFLTAVSAATAAAGTRFTTQQQAALDEIRGMFSSIYGNFDVFVNALKSFRGTADQRAEFIKNELTLLQAQMAATAKPSW